jgi:hypothetical protein
MTVLTDIDVVTLDGVVGPTPKAASYLSRVYVQAFGLEGNQVSTDFFGDDTDTFELVEESLRTFQTQSLGNLDKVTTLDTDIPTVYSYPFKTKVEKTLDSASLVYVQSVSTFPTASQYYYVPMVFERYQPSIMRAIDKEFTQLEVDPLIEPLGE